MFSQVGKQFSIYPCNTPQTMNRSIGCLVRPGTSRHSGWDRPVLINSKCVHRYEVFGDNPSVTHSVGGPSNGEHSALGGIEARRHLETMLGSLSVTAVSALPNGGLALQVLLERPRR